MMSECVVAPARAHRTVAVAGPACTSAGTFHVHTARPPVATAAPSPGCLVPPWERTVSVQVAPDGRTRTEIWPFSPCTTFFETNVKPTPADPFGLDWAD